MLNKVFLYHQASVNVGGTVLNVLSIEHLILRHSPEGKQVSRFTTIHMPLFFTVLIHQLV